MDSSKAALAAALQNNVASEQQLPQRSTSIIDGMSLVHKVKGNQENFGGVASSVLTMALKAGDKSQRIDVVFDTYREMSIKDYERAVRGECQGVQLQNITSKQKVCQWREFLKSGGNKSSIISFVVCVWQTEEYRRKLGDKVLYVTCNDQCYKISEGESVKVSALKCTQEEAHGRILLHAKHAAVHDKVPIVVVAEDTDVFVLCIAFHKNINVPFYQLYGKSRRKVYDIHKIGTAVGNGMCKALVGMHAYTGCDSVSAFSGKGKVKAFKLAMSDRDLQSMFTDLGTNWEVSDALMKKLEKFTCQLYATKYGGDINQLRYHMLCVKKGDIESHQLPPCKDTLQMHIKRANYQVAIWRRSLEQEPDIPGPEGHGWKIKSHDGKNALVVDWMNGEPAPQALLDFLACTCKKQCKLPQCDCMNNGLKCTDMCTLVECSNWGSGNESDEDEDSNDSEDDINAMNNTDNED